MQSIILRIALDHSNLLAVQRAKKILRLRYGINLPRRHEQRDPIWLRAHD